MAAVRAAINYPGIKVEPGTVKIEPGVSTDSVNLATSTVTSNPDLYMSQVTVEAAAAVKTEATTTC